MKFLAITLIPYAPDPITGIQPSTTERLRSVVDNATLAEELGFDGYGVGERHERPFLSSSPPVMLSHIAALCGPGRCWQTPGRLDLPRRFRVRPHSGCRRDCRVLAQDPPRR